MFYKLDNNENNRKLIVVGLNAFCMPKKKSTFKKYRIRDTPPGVPEMSKNREDQAEDCFDELER